MEKWIKCNVEDCQVVITGICVRQSTDNHDNGGEENKYELIALMTIPKDKKLVSTSMFMVWEIMMSFLI
ncbi:hypothetical protein NBRC111894_4274 [Sporolactobacillus inulinus]|uniref:Uncharacterized protein n=1 Tax=Sporolactobacillus inulinus TaxID=2078 RepID=A0A4Y1ZI85_9BACL|nr:hypothetical protein [Sporolactobacillus inulinus]GAY78720.1 hypothetical protein NBRC111894_4274 [Sporolactobacillus inulinus]